MSTAQQHNRCLQRPLRILVGAIAWLIPTLWYSYSQSHRGFVSVVDMDALMILPSRLDNNNNNNNTSDDGPWNSSAAWSLPNTSAATAAAVAAASFDYPKALTTKGTRIIAVADKNYQDIAAAWYEQLTKLGYANESLIVVTADHEATTYLRDMRNISSVETILPTNSSDFPIFNNRLQMYRRRLFGTRWVYVLKQLLDGYHVLLRDVDNLFVRYMPMSSLEQSDFDIIHAYAGNFPIRFLSMGFTVCGGMSWIRSCPETIEWVRRILHACDWKGKPSKHTQDANTFTRDDPIGDLTKHARCDDQQIINRFFFDNELNFTWTSAIKPTRIEQDENGTLISEPLFWKGSMSGKSEVTGHKFSIWDVNVAYRGPVDGYKGRCPNNTWVAMPWNTIDEISPKVSAFASDRLKRWSQWYEFCENTTKDVQR